MRSLTSPYRLVFIFSLSFTATSFSFPQFFPSFPNPNPNPRFHSKPSRRFSLSSPATTATATAGDILSLLGSEDDASKIDSDEAQQLWSCLKFLVPFRRNQVNRRSMAGKPGYNGSDDWENELVWWPPVPVLELARLAVDSGGDPDAIYRALDPTIIPR